MKSLGPQGTETVMVVEDQREVRALTIRILELAGYAVVGAENGRAAVTLLWRQPVHLMVLDMMLEPSFDGLDCYRAAIAIRPGQKAIIVSGYADIDRVVEAQRLGAGRCIPKPFTVHTLLQAVREELG
jgi:two-component system, cell cycle sensor histidine kinase and response regulator CckA